MPYGRDATTTCIPVVICFQKTKYYNYYAHQVAETIISNYDIDYVHKRLNGEQQRVCEQLNLTPSDSVWLATSTHEDWSKFRRQDDIARICLAGVYEL